MSDAIPQLFHWWWNQLNGPYTSCKASCILRVSAIHYGIHYILIQMTCCQLTPSGRVCLEIALRVTDWKYREWLAWGPFFKSPGNFSASESHSKISNLMITELFYSRILNINRRSLHTTETFQAYVLIRFKIQMS